MTITEPERLSLEKLRGLASAAPPCISIVLLEREARDARIAFKDALAQVHAKVAASASRREPSVDFSRDILAHQAKRLLVLRDSDSGWTDLGSPDGVLGLLAKQVNQPAWFHEAHSFSSDLGMRRKVV